MTFTEPLLGRRKKKVVHATVMTIDNFLSVEKILKNIRKRKTCIMAKNAVDTLSEERTIKNPF